jgi:hypothetical protein
MCDAFDIDNEKVDHCRLDVLQNNFAQFNYGQLRTLELLWVLTQEGSPMLPSCMLLQIWYL